MKSLSDTLGFLGLLFIIIGLFRVVKNLNFLSSLSYGYNNFLNLLFKNRRQKNKVSYKDYYDYLEKNKYKKAYFKFILVGLGLLILSVVVFYI